MPNKHIEVQIANRKYPLEVDQTEVEKLKVAAQLVNDNINKLKGNYVVTDYVDLLAMTALELAMGSDEDLEQLKHKAINDALDSELDQISDLIDSCLDSGIRS